MILSNSDILRKLHDYHGHFLVATVRHAAVGSPCIVLKINNGQKDEFLRTPANINLTGRGFHK